MSELIRISQEIQQRIELLKDMRAKIRTFGKSKAELMVEYEKAMARTTIGLKNGKKYKLEDGFEIEKPPATIMDRIAKGICWQEKLKHEISENDYKGLIVSMNTVQCEMNGLQSLFRYLEEVESNQKTTGRTT